MYSLYCILLHIVFSRAEFYSEYKKKFRPFSQYDYVEGKFKAKKGEPEPMILHELTPGDSWYREVLELRKKAGEYKVIIL